LGLGTASVEVPLPAGGVAHGMETRAWLGALLGAATPNPRECVADGARAGFLGFVTEDSARRPSSQDALRRGAWLLRRIAQTLVVVPLPGYGVTRFPVALLFRGITLFGTRTGVPCTIRITCCVGTRLSGWRACCWIANVIGGLAAKGYLVGRTYRADRELDDMFENG